MRLLAFLFLTSLVFAKNILLTNDDGWTATNIRAAYNKLKAAGHNVILVAPVSQRSGYGGQFAVPQGNKLQTNGEFGYVKAGDPAWGHEPDDQAVWYFNGTPGSSVAFGLTYVIPKYFNNLTVDLIVGGPNEGTNLSPGFFTLSGTIAAIYNGVYRGIPGVAFSGSVGDNAFFKDADLDDESQYYNIYAGLVVDFVNKLFKSQGAQNKTLPLSVGLNVNFPLVGQGSNCTNPKWVHTRITGPASITSNLQYNETSNTFSGTSNTFDGMLPCYNGICDLPSEAYILDETDCQSSISVFSTDYDAKTSIAKDIFKRVL